MPPDAKAVDANDDETPFPEAGPNEVVVQISNPGVVAAKYKCVEPQNDTLTILLQRDPGDADGDYRLYITDPKTWHKIIVTEITVPADAVHIGKDVQAPFDAFCALDPDSKTIPVDDSTKPFIVCVPTKSFLGALATAAKSPSLTLVLKNEQVLFHFGAITQFVPCFDAQTITNVLAMVRTLKTSALGIVSIHQNGPIPKVLRFIRALGVKISGDITLQLVRHGSQLKLQIEGKKLGKSEMGHIRAEQKLVATDAEIARMASLFNQEFIFGGRAFLEAAQTTDQFYIVETEGDLAFLFEAYSSTSGVRHSMPLTLILGDDDDDE